MKKALLIAILASFTYAQNLQMPPAIPMLDTKAKENKKQNKNSNTCEQIPPMLHMLPPPLQDAVDACQNEKFMPKKQQVKNYLKKNKIAYKSINIKPTEGFTRVYTITLENNKKLICNEKVTKCFEIK